MHYLIQCLRCISKTTDKCITDSLIKITCSFSVIINFVSVGVYKGESSGNAAYAAFPRQRSVRCFHKCICHRPKCHRLEFLLHFCRFFRIILKCDKCPVCVFAHLKTIRPEFLCCACILLHRNAQIRIDFLPWAIFRDVLFQSHHLGETFQHFINCFLRIVERRLNLRRLFCEPLRHGFRRTVLCTKNIFGHIEIRVLRIGKIVRFRIFFHIPILCFRNSLC